MKKIGITLCLLVISFCFVPLEASEWMQERNARRMVERYEGLWQGQYTISTLGGHPLGIIEVEQRYRLEDDSEGQQVLRGWAVYSRSGVLTHARSQTTRDGATLFTVIMHADDKEEHFRGIVRGNSVTWTPEPEQEEKRREITDTIQRDKEGRFIAVQGYERVVYEGQDSVVVIKGKLRQLSEEATLPEQR